LKFEENSSDSIRDIILLHMIGMKAPNYTLNKHHLKDLLDSNPSPLQHCHLLVNKNSRWDFPVAPDCSTRDPGGGVKSRSKGWR